MNGPSFARVNQTGVLHQNSDWGMVSNPLSGSTYATCWWIATFNEPQKRRLLTFAPKTFLNDTFDIDYLRDKVSFVGLCVGEIANSIWELQA